MKTHENYLQITEGGSYEVTQDNQIIAVLTEDPVEIILPKLSKGRQLLIKSLVASPDIVVNDQEEKLITTSPVLCLIEYNGIDFDVREITSEIRVKSKTFKGLNILGGITLTIQDRVTNSVFLPISAFIVVKQNPILETIIGRIGILTSEYASQQNLILTFITSGLLNAPNEIGDVLEATFEATTQGVVVDLYVTYQEVLL